MIVDLTVTDAQVLELGDAGLLERSATRQPQGGGQAASEDAQTRVEAVEDDGPSGAAKLLPFIAGGFAVLVCGVVCALCLAQFACSRGRRPDSKVSDSGRAKKVVGHADDADDDLPASIAMRQSGRTSVPSTDHRGLPPSPQRRASGRGSGAGPLHHAAAAAAGSAQHAKKAWEPQQVVPPRAVTPQSVCSTATGGSGSAGAPKLAPCRTPERQGTPPQQVAPPTNAASALRAAAGERDALAASQLDQSQS